jgi:hypothetical protein
VKPMGEIPSFASRSVSPDPRKTAATNERRSEPSEQLGRAPVARALRAAVRASEGAADECQER